MAIVHRTGSFPVPCLQLAIEIGQVAEQLLHASAEQQPQLEKQLGQLQGKYQQQCGQSMASGAGGSRYKPYALSLEFLRETAFLELANEVRVIFGGNDGILVTIDAAGHIQVSPPQGPGDPEVRQAVTSIIQGVQVLNGKIGGVTQRGAAAA